MAADLELDHVVGVEHAVAFQARTLKVCGRMRGSKREMACAIVRSSCVMSSRETPSPAKGGRPKLSTQRVRSGVRSAHRGVRLRGVEQPAEVAQHRLAQLRLGHQARFLGLLALGRVVDQAIEQGGLQPVAQIGCGLVQA